jgi:hypothetical protein
MTGRCSDRSNNRMSPRGTVGTIRTMVPTCVGDRESRGPRDHATTIFYMSRATPKKRVEWPARPGSWPAPAESRLPLAHRDHGPDGPNGPKGHRRVLATAAPGAPSFGSQVFAFAQASAGPSRLDGPDTVKGASNLRRTPSRRVLPNCWPGRPQAPSAGVRERHRLNRLSENPHGALVFYDELASWFSSFGRYSSDGDASGAAPSGTRLTTPAPTSATGLRTRDRRSPSRPPRVRSRAPSSQTDCASSGTRPPMTAYWRG